MNRNTLIWVLVGVLGVMLTAGITAAASQLASQDVGLSSEPISAGEDLAPRPEDSAATSRSRARRQERARETSRERTETQTTTTPTTPSGEAGDDRSGSSDASGSDDGGGDDDGGKGRGRGRGRSGDDD